MGKKVLDSRRTCVSILLSVPPHFSLGSFRFLLPVFGLLLVPISIQLTPRTVDEIWVQRQIESARAVVGGIDFVLDAAMNCVLYREAVREISRW